MCSIITSLVTVVCLLLLIATELHIVTCANNEPGSIKASPSGDSHKDDPAETSPHSPETEEGEVSL